VPDATPPPSVLDALADRTGLRSKILLPDSDSEHGTSPVIDPSTASKLVPQGRGNYRLLGEIARGGMGVIFKGHDTDLGRDVAVKVLDGELAKKPAVVQRFVEEAQIGGQLQHPGIVPVYELGLMAGDVPYFTMKLVKGRTLAALLAQRKSAADERGRLLAIFESVCQTMAYAHSKSVLHRDLKPANIMVGAFGEVQVVDWGLAKVMQRGGVADEKRAQQQSSVNTVIETVRSGPGSTGSESLVGSVMGTPAYMAPEQAQGEVELLDERADVFSLGAILCELLTGKPPYVPIEGETLLHQAGRAKLGPARERIEGCGADPALVKLCLECLTPAREMRPASAELVARSMHEYLVTVEERARKAEIEAAEARLKAAEERRARRLTLALGGAILLAIVLGSAGLWWANRERAKRLELTRNEVESAQGESLQLGQAGKPAEALAAARRALSIAESGAPDAALVERARNFVARAEQTLHAAERERALAQQDETLRTRLVDLRLRQISTINYPDREAALDAAFTQAFHDYGVDLEGEDVLAALERIRERKIALDVALALDDWGRLRRRVHGANSPKVENLTVLALDLDPDPLRHRMRDAIANRDLPAMLELTSPEGLKELVPGSIFVLCAAIWEGFPDRKQDVYRIFEQALQDHPGDFALQSLAASFYQEGLRFEQALLCCTAARALRPDDVETRLTCAQLQAPLGHLTQAEATLRGLLEADPTHPEGNDLEGVVQWALGDYAGGLESLSRSPAIASDRFLRGDLEIARYFTGAVQREAIERLADTEINYPLVLRGYLFALLNHPDPAQRSPEFVLRLLRERAGILAEFRWPAAAEALAYMRLEDFQRAVDSFERSYKRAPTILTQMTFDFMRAVAYARIGREDAARQWYLVGMDQWEKETADHPEAWDHSAALHWRREAEAALSN
jgi:tetratricopeptide (TPR) repeat protein